MLSFKSVWAVSPCCPAALAGRCVELQREELGLHLWIRAGCRQLCQGASAKRQSSSSVSCLLIWLRFRHSCFQGIAIAKVRVLPSVLRFYPLEFLNSFQKCRPRPRQSRAISEAALSILQQGLCCLVITQGWVLFPLCSGAVLPCHDPGLGSVRPVLWGCAAHPQLGQPAFPGLPQPFCLVLHRQRTLIVLQAQ